MTANNPISQPVPVEADTALATTVPTLVEDTLLALYQPTSGTIAGETILYYVLGGAVLAELAFDGLVEARRVSLFHRAFPIGETPPSDALLRPAWDMIIEKPRNVQTVLAAVGPYLREPVLHRLVERGDLARTRRLVLGLIPSTSLTLGSDRRREIVERVRAALVDGVDPAPRTAVVAALLSASNTLPQFHPEIPWSGEVYTRGQSLERGNWGAAAAAAAVTRTMAAIVTSSISTALGAAAARSTG